MKNKKFLGTILFVLGLSGLVIAAGETKFKDSIFNGAVAIGTTSAANSKAALDVVSTTKGFLPPRHTTTQRDAISSPTEGLTLYNSTTHYLGYYNATAWLEVASLTGTEALTNKSMSGSANTFTNISGSSLVNTSVDLTTKVTGVLPNANTTAASANTASAIVTRDGSGNFAAGVITATLTGNASTATLASTVTTNANLTGEVTSSGNAATLTNSAVIGKVLTGYTSGAGTVASTDTILQAIQKLNGNAVAAASIPSGTVTMFAGASAPTGWMFCDGTAISRTTYADLFTAIADTWGIGDGSTTFNLPDMRGRAPIGVGTGSGLTARALAATGGEESHVLTIAELAAHTHDQNPNQKASVAGTTGTDLFNSTVGNSTALSLTTGSRGSDAAHNTMMPYRGINFIIKL